MPTYNPKDMAYVLQMSKSSGKYTPEEMALMQDINQNVAGGAMTGMPMQGQQMGQARTQLPLQQTSNPYQNAQGMGQQQQMGGSPLQNQEMPQGVPMNRLQQIQAAANQVLAGGQNPEGQNMANIAKYFQGRQ
jgi:hypothetical protein